MITRFFNGKILRLIDDNFVVTEEDLIVIDNKIAYIGRGNNNITIDKQIDLKGNLLMAGFKNCHTHSAMTLLRSNADDLPLIDWLNNQVFPLEAKMTEEDVYYGSKLSLMEYLSSGITTVSDMYFFEDAFIKAMTESGFRSVAVGAYSGECDEKKLESIEEKHFRYNKISPLFSYKLGFHAEYTASKELLQGISKLSHKYNLPVYTHLSESERENHECFNRTQMSPTQFLDSFGLFDNGGGFYHCVQMSDNDLDILAKNNVYVVTNCGSNAKLASGIPRLCEIANKGIKIAIGTDGAASNNSLDMFKEMFMVTSLQKLKYFDASVMPAEQVLKMAICDSANSLGLQDCNNIAVGKLADLIVLDLNQPNMQPLNNIIKNIVYAGNKSNVIMTMVNGKVLYENGNYNIGIDKETVFEKCNNIIKRLKQN